MQPIIKTVANQKQELALHEKRKYATILYSEGKVVHALLQASFREQIDALVFVSGCRRGTYIAKGVNFGTFPTVEGRAVKAQKLSVAGFLRFTPRYLKRCAVMVGQRSNLGPRFKRVVLNVSSAAKRLRPRDYRVLA
jgi:hypothetical protein